MRWGISYCMLDKYTEAVFLSSRKSLSSGILEDKFISLVLVFGPQSLRKFSRTSHSANSPLCMTPCSINSVTATVHENGLLTDIGYYLQILLLSSRKVLVLEDPREPIYKSLSLSSDLKSVTTSFHRRLFAMWYYLPICQLHARPYNNCIAIQESRIPGLMASKSRGFRDWNIVR